MPQWKSCMTSAMIQLTWSMTVFNTYIVYAKYKLEDLQKYVNACMHLTSTKRHQLYKLLKEFDDLFDGSLGHWTRKLYPIKLEPGIKPYYSH